VQALWQHVHHETADETSRVKPLVLPVRSPDLNAYSERWLGSLKEEILCKVLLIGERSLRLHAEGPMPQTCRAIRPKLYGNNSHS
jgi:hypothetical protein